MFPNGGILGDSRKGSRGGSSLQCVRHAVRSSRFVEDSGLWS